MTDASTEKPEYEKPQLTLIPVAELRARVVDALLACASEEHHTRSEHEQSQQQLEDAASTARGFGFESAEIAAIIGGDRTARMVSAMVRRSRQRAADA